MSSYAVSREGRGHCSRGREGLPTPGFPCPYNAFQQLLCLLPHKGHILL